MSEIWNNQYNHSLHFKKSLFLGATALAGFLAYVGYETHARDNVSPSPQNSPMVTGNGSPANLPATPNTIYLPSNE